ncbi:MAG: hypothetical protein Q8M98_00300 [Candidatus Cloacimonadaceae bacterium]|nr:hypothetical protein [Candidatus Cloacimonadaceae bacterium]MDP3113191.1 hypothetical protein [Candidatus Cloacimonadaceae bacterium]
MNLMEMVLALFAVVFFSTVAMMYNRATMNQTDLLINANQYVQASHLSHSILDEVDAKLFSRQLAFAAVKPNYNTTRTLDLAHTGGRYILVINTVECDSLGTPVSVVPINNIYLRVRVSTSTSGLRTPVVMQRVYTKTHLNI